MKNQSRFFVMVLSLVMLVSFFATPVTAIANVPTGETYEAYDEIGFDDLFIGSESMAGKTKDGSNNYTYVATAPTFSSVFKFRWIPGNTPQFTLFLDDWVYPFCFAAKTPNQTGFGKTAGPNGAWHLVPSDGNLMVNMNTPIVAGSAYDMEMGRLKVKTGANMGKYYVYWKVNGQLIQSYYYSGVTNGTYNNGTKLSNDFIISSPAGNQFCGIPVEETFDAYDEIGFDDLYIGEDTLAGQTMFGGTYSCTYHATSPSYSVIFKCRWIPGGNELKFRTYFDDWVYPFCFAVKTPNQDGFGKIAGPNGAWHLVPSNGDLMVDMDTPIVAGNAYDMEMGRLKVKTGANKGKYYVFWKVNGELIQSYYYGGVTNGTYDNGAVISNKILFDFPVGNKFGAYNGATPYENYDVIEYADLYQGGKPVGAQTATNGATVFTYDRTSPTGSVILKYGWKVGTVPKFQLSFEKTSDTAMEYVFGAWLEPDEQYANGKMWLRPGYGPQVNLPAALDPSSEHSVEFARLKVKIGENAGKYYVYLKIDSELVAEDYVDAKVVDSNLCYTSEPNQTVCDMKSGEIIIAFWGSEGNAISDYHETYYHQGVRGNFNENGIIDAADLVVLQSALLGRTNLGTAPAEIIDFNNDSGMDVRDLVAMKKYLAPVQDHKRSGNLVVGIQEHLLKDETKTAAYIADASATLGAKSYRLSIPIDYMFKATITNGIEIRTEWLENCREMVRQLKANGIDEILYVSAEFVMPYGYNDDVTKVHTKTVPDPLEDKKNYLNWLKVNAAAYKVLAQEFPEIKFFEPFNEINVEQGSRLEKYGINWGATPEEQAAYKYTVQQRAGIMADLCWYVSRAVKSVDRTNQVTTPSISFNTTSNVETDFLEKFYLAIESGEFPRGQACGDINTNNYFTILNIHSYKNYSKDNSNVSEWVKEINQAYDVVRAHHDTAKPVWMTETGCATKGSRTAVGTNITAVLKAINQQLPYIDTVQIFQLSDATALSTELEYGVFYSGTNPNNPYGIKDGAKAIYSYLHNGSQNYSALNALVKRYAG